MRKKKENNFKVMHQNKSHFHHHNIHRFITHTLKYNVMNMLYNLKHEKSIYYIYRVVI